ncbi:S-layer homology domain-containing protein [Candidatus Saccharibacteria bacterium]|nr:S-layer homology domain-containing protein [Candidatus Saccharibacteria bacterium]
MRNPKVRVLLIMAMVVMLLATPLGVFAASGDPYQDVTKMSVDRDAYKAISYVKKHHGYKKVVTGKDFYPDQTITRAEFLAMLGNFYGKKNIRVTLNDVLYANKGITEKYAVNKLVNLANRHFKVRFGWMYGSCSGMTFGQTVSTKPPKITRAEASSILYSFAKMNKKFRPKK